MRRLTLLFVICLFLVACESIALLSTPKKQALDSKNNLAQVAEQFFWKTLHQGNYKNIDASIRLLMIAYLKNPYDPKLAAHLGFMHLWKITERSVKPNPRMPDEIILARKYFEDAVMLAPNNAIYLGFLGDAQLVEGKIFADKREQVKGYYQLKRAISSWPQFNYFTAGYPMSTLSSHSTLFKETLEWQWNTLDLCAGQKVNRQNPDFSPFMSKEIKTGPYRACWNSWIAPFNFEGFFLNMGDMLVKAGQWQTAIRIYQNAKLTNNYKSWPYRKFLEERIVNAQVNTKVFQKDNYGKQAILFNSGYGCQVCHKQAAS
ncbi:hypothetical protein ACNVED_15500 (plasmid) [Legionella sp. D16C41]|uniref:hypothetical protein n=1 Tax=Legionella sp. D16C41 TaxID=3402688 RepID=UPI003AF629BF